MSGVMHSAGRSSMLYDLEAALRESRAHAELNEAAVSGHEERLERRLGEFGLRRRRVAPDGDCQFSAISDQLLNDPRDADQFRQLAVRWLRPNACWRVVRRSESEFRMATI